MEPYRKMNYRKKSNLIKNIYQPFYVCWEQMFNQIRLLDLEKGLPVLWVSHKIFPWNNYQRSRPTKIQNYSNKIIMRGFNIRVVHVYSPKKIL